VGHCCGRVRLRAGSSGGAPAVPGGVFYPGRHVPAHDGAPPLIVTEPSVSARNAFRLHVEMAISKSILVGIVFGVALISLVVTFVELPSGTQIVLKVPSGHSKVRVPYLIVSLTVRGHVSTPFDRRLIGAAQEWENPTATSSATRQTPHKPCEGTRPTSGSAAFGR
jgi:hypothetical protein